MLRLLIVTEFSDFESQMIKGTVSNHFLPSFFSKSALHHSYDHKYCTLNAIIYYFLLSSNLLLIASNVAVFHNLRKSNRFRHTILSVVNDHINIISVRIRTPGGCDKVIHASLKLHEKSTRWHCYKYVHPWDVFLFKTRDGSVTVRYNSRDQITWPTHLIYVIYLNAANLIGRHLACT